MWWTDAKFRQLRLRKCDEVFEVEVGMQKLTGKVKWFNSDKGYGFITHEGADYFVHFSQVAMGGYRKLEEQQTVTFEPREGDKGLSAYNVEVVS